MLSILYSFLFSYMLFFTICVAPIINTTLDKENSSRLLRKIFPRNFLYGIFISFLIILISIYNENIFSIFVSSIILILFILNLFILIPKINSESDKAKKLTSYSIKFKKLHLLSIIFYSAQMILSLNFIIFEVIA